MAPFKVLREGLGAGLAPEAVLVPPGLLRHDPLDDVGLLAADRAVLVHLHRRNSQLLQNVLKVSWVGTVVGARSVNPGSSVHVLPLRALYLNVPRLVTHHKTGSVFKPRTFNFNLRLLWIKTTEVNIRCGSFG